MKVAILTPDEINGIVTNAIEKALEAQTPPKEDVYVTAAKYAAIKGLHRNTVSNQVKSGVLKTKLFGKKKLVLLTDG